MSAGVTVAPAFFPEDERWVRTATDHGSILEEQNRLAKARAKMELIYMLRTFSAELWRHQLEREKGEKQLWETISGHRAWWVNDVGLAPAPAPRAPTRWQLNTMSLFGLLLQPPNETFDMKNDQHLARLARLMRKAEEEKDEQLVQIIRFFFSSM